MTASTWPTHEDGTDKTVGEMTPEERRSVIRDARVRFAASRGMSAASLAVIDSVLRSIGAPPAA